MSPMRAGHPCAHPGCNEIVYRGSRCGAHVETFHDQGYRRWYRTEAWQRIRVGQLLAEPWCAECAKHGDMRKATDVDHINAHRGDERAFFGGPFQSLCHSHHSAKTRREVQGGGA